MNLRIVILFVCFFSVNAHAAIDSSGLLNNVFNQYSAASATWATQIKSSASFLFWLLTTVSLVWTFGVLALRRADIGEFFSEFIKFIMFTGFYFWLLNNSPGMATDIINSMITIGENASTTGKANPSEIMDLGFQLLYAAMNTLSLGDPIVSIATLAISLAILVCLTLVAVNMLLTMICGWILAYAGIFYLGFGGSRWTSDMAISYFRTVLSIGTQLMAMVLLVGIGKTIVENYMTNMGPEMNIDEMAVVLVSSIVLMVLVNKVPAFLGQLALGGGTGALGQGYGASAAITAAGLTASAIGTASSMVSSTASNALGGVQAIQAAHQKALSDNAQAALPPSLDSGSSPGVDVAQTMGTTSTPSSTHSASQSDAAPKSSASPKSNTFSNLVEGVKDVIGQKVQQRVDSTFFGQVANTIKDNTSPLPDSNTDSSRSTFNDDSLQGEIDDFVNQPNNRDNTN